MNTCKTCAHWKFDPETNSSIRLAGFCAPVDADTWKPMQMPFTVRQCKHPALAEHERPVEQNGFAVADGSDYWAMLLTAEDFGCVRHEPFPTAGN